MSLEELKALFIVDCPEPIAPKFRMIYRHRCEFPHCGSGIHEILPEGWSQCGKSRFLSAPQGLASWCEHHSFRGAMIATDQMLEINAVVDKEGKP